MKLNAKKTKVMYVGRNQYYDVVIDGVVFERVSDFIYFGSSKSSDGSCSNDIKRRKAQAKNENDLSEKYLER